MCFFFEGGRGIEDSVISLFDVTVVSTAMSGSGIFFFWKGEVFRHGEDIFVGFCWK